MPIPYKQKSLLKFSYMHAIGQKLKIQHHVNNFGHFSSTYGFIWYEQTKYVLMKI